MKPFPTHRIVPLFIGAFFLGLVFILCFFCWQYITCTYRQASEELVYSISRVEARLISGN